MMEQHGHSAGYEDGKSDAAAGNLIYPIPTIALCLLSSGYLSAYLAGYKKGYANQERVMQEVRRRADIRVQELKNKRPAERTHYQKPADHQAELER